MIFALIQILLLGWVCGCVVNYVCDVMPFSRKLTAPICVSCEAKQSWMEYLTFRRCKQCGKPRSIRTWLVQAAGVLGCAYLWFFPPKALGFWIALILSIYFAIVMVMDLEYRVVLNPISIVGVIIGLGVGIKLHGWLALAGGAAGFAAMLLLYYAGDWYAKRLAKKRGEELDEVALGFGDVNLMGILGLILGFPGVFLGLMSGILLGGAVSIILLIVQLLRKQYQPFTAIPYAPFLVLGTVLLLFPA